MLYLDTSVLVAALTREMRTAAIQAWLAQQPVETLHISPWVITEFSSALALKLRTRDLEMHQRADVLSMFNQLTETSFTVIEVTPRDYHNAARFADRHETGLRAGDGLHLAVAGRLGLRLCSLDDVLVEAGRLLGVSTELL